MTTTENHDHSRFLADFGVLQPDEASNDLFLLAKGIPVLRVRQERAEVRSPNHFFVADRGYQLRGVMVFTRQDAGATTVVAVNFTVQAAALDLVLPALGTWREELSDTALVVTGPTAPVVVPSSYGLVLTSR